MTTLMCCLVCSCSDTLVVVLFVVVVQSYIAHPVIYDTFIAGLVCSAVYLIHSLCDLFVVVVQSYIHCLSCLCSLYDTFSHI